MNDIYNYIEKNTFEIKNCITRYIGYIVSVSFFSGFLGIFFSAKITPTEKLLLILITGVIITLMFKVIWYKFKSHNRFEGFKYLISHEESYISVDKLSLLNLTKEHINFIGNNNNPSRTEILESKIYIKYYRDFISKDAQEINNIGSFVNCMSRLNDSYITNRNINNKQILKNILKSSQKSAMFVFSVPEKSYDNIDIKENDRLFFEKVIWNLYGRNDEKLSFLSKIKLLLKRDFFPKEEYFKVDTKYANMSWKYPREITQIAFFSMGSLFFLQAVILFRYFNFTNDINFESLSPVLPIAGQVILIIYWFQSYINKLEDLLYGRYSIEGYFWKFFLFRVQFINSVSNLIPVYFSRNFVRFFKTNLILKFIDERAVNLSRIGNYEYFGELVMILYTNASTEIKKKVVEKFNQNSVDKISISYFNTEINKERALFLEYYKKLVSLKKFNTKEHIIHGVIKELSSL